MFDAGDALIYETPPRVVSLPEELQEASANWSAAVPQSTAVTARRVGVVHHSFELPAEQIPAYVALDEQGIPTFTRFNPRAWTVQSLKTDVPQLTFAFSQPVG